MSLLNEMELSDSERSLNNSRRPFSQIDEEEPETEHPPDTNLSTLEEKELKEEILSCYQQIRALSGQLRRRDKHRRNSNDSLDVDSNASSSSSDEPATVDAVKAGILKESVQVRFQPLYIRFSFKWLSLISGMYYIKLGIEIS